MTIARLNEYCLVVNIATHANDRQVAAVLTESIASSQTLVRELFPKDRHR